jgi:hypothetical protein
MTSQPEKPVGPVDIKNLLDLLAASEADPASDAADIENYEPPPTQSLPDSLGGRRADSRFAPDPAEKPFPADDTDNRSIKDEVENRFAAHIVQGMSKIKPR